MAIYLNQTEPLFSDRAYVVRDGYIYQDTCGGNGRLLTKVTAEGMFYQQKENLRVRRAATVKFWALWVNQNLNNNF